MNLLKSAFAIFALFVSTSAKADLLLEPYVGYEASTYTANVNSGGSVKQTLTGVNYGARVGYALPLLWFALDYNASSPTGTVNEQPSGYSFTNNNWSRSTLAAVVGVKVPLLQVYVGYAPLNEWTDKAPTGDIKFIGSGMKFGVGYTGIPFFAINFEYLATTFTKYNSGGTDSTIGGSPATYSSITGGTVMVNLSLPLRL